MADEVIPAAPIAAAPVPAPAAVAAPTPPAAAPVAAAPAPAASPDDLPAVGSPGWLKARTDRATESGEKKARKELKAERRAAKSAAEEAVKVKSHAEGELAAAKRFADNLLTEVPDADRAAISAASGGSITKTLELLTTWRMAKGMTLSATPPAPVVAAPPPVAAAPAVPPAPDVPAAPPQRAPLAAPAHTAPDAGAPAPAVPSGPEDYRGTYQNLLATNPYLAREYLLNHQAQIVPDKLRPVDQQGRPINR